MNELARRHARFGWVLVLLSLCFGAALESLEAFRWAPLVLDGWKTRLWSLAHFHGVALGLVNLVYVQWADVPSLSAAAKRAASGLLLAGSVLMPLGFLLGGVGHSEVDPSLGVLLSPAGALLVILSVALQTRAAFSAK